MNKQRILNLQDESAFGKNLCSYYEFISWARFYPDLFIELFKAKTGGINLHFDQRVFLRSDVRFMSMYGTFSRGCSKTFNEVLDMFIVAMLFPGIELALTAQTKENAAELLKDKTNELLKYFPLLQNELLEKPRFPKGDGEVKFLNDSRIDVLANAQSTKGQRRKRMRIEEAALLDDITYQDALKPVVEVPRYTVGKLAIVDPQELNQQINFFTTSGFRGSTEFQRSVNMYNNMINLKGDIVLGSNWMLPCWFSRGSNKSQILEKKRTMSPISFAQNYEQEWVGSSDGALVDINNLLRCRVLETAECFSNDNNSEYYIGVDVARSQNTNNNQSSVVVGKIDRDKFDNRIKHIDIPFVMNIPNIMNFKNQAIEVKRIKKAFNAKMVIIDGNVIGSGLVDELLKPSYDPVTNDYLGCWDTVNTDNKPEEKGAEKCLYDLKAQGINAKIITYFMDYVNSGILRLLKKKENTFYELEKYKSMDSIMPFLQTDLLVEEISNLKIKHISGGGISVEQLVKKIDKDRYSALAYMLWYVHEFESKIKIKSQNTNASLLEFRKPKLLRK